MREFRSFAKFAEHLAECATAEVLALHEGMVVVAERVKKTAKDELGHYQPAIGKFEAWSPLTESTKADRIRQGYTPDDPLLRSGELRESIVKEVEGLEAVVGSLDQVAVYQELGTSKIPPRPFLGPAVVRNENFIRDTIGIAAVSGMLGQKSLPKSLGYGLSDD